MVRSSHIDIQFTDQGHIDMCPVLTFSARPMSREKDLILMGFDSVRRCEEDAELQLSPDFVQLESALAPL